MDMQGRSTQLQGIWLKARTQISNEMQGAEDGKFLKCECSAPDLPSCMNLSHVCSESTRELLSKSTEQNFESTKMHSEASDLVDKTKELESSQAKQPSAELNEIKVDAQRRPEVPNIETPPPIDEVVVTARPYSPSSNTLRNIAIGAAVVGGAVVVKGALGGSRGGGSNNDPASKFENAGSPAINANSDRMQSLCAEGRLMGCP
jgi:hypothetical protein